MYSYGLIHFFLFFIVSGLTFLSFLPGCTVIISSSSEKTMLSTLITMQFSFFFLLMFQESLFEAGIGRQITSHPFLISEPSSEFQLYLHYSDELMLQIQHAEVPSQR